MNGSGYSQQAYAHQQLTNTAYHQPYYYNAAPSAPAPHHGSHYPTNPTAPYMPRVPSDGRDTSFHSHPAPSMPYQPYSTHPNPSYSARPVYGAQYSARPGFHAEPAYRAPFTPHQSAPSMPQHPYHEQYEVPQPPVRTSSLSHHPYTTHAQHPFCYNPARVNCPQWVPPVVSHCATTLPPPNPPQSTTAPNPAVDPRLVYSDPYASRTHLAAPAPSAPTHNIVSTAAFPASTTHPTAFAPNAAAVAALPVYSDLSASPPHPAAAAQGHAFSTAALPASTTPAVPSQQQPQQTAAPSARPAAQEEQDDSASEYGAPHGKKIYFRAVSNEEALSMRARPLLEALLEGADRSAAAVERFVEGRVLGVRGVVNKLKGGKGERPVFLPWVIVTGHCKSVSVVDHGLLTLHQNDVSLGRDHICGLPVIVSKGGRHLLDRIDIYE